MLEALNLGRNARWLIVSVLVWIADRVTKVIVVQELRLGQEIPVLPFFSWIRLHNEGAAFSLLATAGGWQRWFFVVIALAFTAFLIYELRRLVPGQWLYGLAFSLILGGAWGNLYDRVVNGYVVDFVLVHYQRLHFFPAFNVADAAITVGAGIWILLLIQESLRERRERRAGAGDSGRN